MGNGPARRNANLPPCGAIRPALTLLLVLLLALPGCEKEKAVPPQVDPSPSSSPATTPPLEGPGVAVVAKFQCNRCHVIPGIEPVGMNADCRGCHRAIITRAYPAEDEYLDRWNAGLTTMRDTPSLTALDRRIHREWFIEFLREPHDLRPRLGATMPRMRVSASEAETLADLLGLKTATTASFEGDVARGRAIAEAKGCGSCHVMTGLEGGLAPSEIPITIRPETLARSMLIAPDLRYTRERFQPDALVAWLLDPPSMKRDALMPNLKLSPEQAQHLGAFLLRVPLAEPPAAPAKLVRPEPLDREVRWEEVREKLIDQICQHCHSDPSFNDGDGGPGNTGGFGFAGRGIDFSSYQRTVYGADGSKEPLAIWKPTADGTPKIIAHLLARHEEAAGRPGELRGMPLGFPPVELERIRLLDTWIRQGMPE